MFRRGHLILILLFLVGCPGEPSKTAFTHTNSFLGQVSAAPLGEEEFQVICQENGCRFDLVEHPTVYDLHQHAQSRGLHPSPMVRRDSVKDPLIEELPMDLQSLLPELMDKSNRRQPNLDVDGLALSGVPGWTSKINNELNFGHNFTPMRGKRGKRVRGVVTSY